MRKFSVMVIHSVMSRVSARRSPSIPFNSGVGSSPKNLGREFLSFFRRSQNPALTMVKKSFSISGAMSGVSRVVNFRMAESTFGAGSKQSRFTSKQFFASA